MGVNKIGALFIPDYYVKVDRSEWPGEDWKTEVLPMVERGIPCLLWDWFGISASNVTNVPRCVHHNIPDGHKNCATQWHKPICTAYNSISIMVQWAVQLGFTEIVLVGCDLNFTNGRDDHFNINTGYYQKVDAQYQERNERFTRAAHDLIRLNCPVPIYDATINGVLNYPRLELCPSNVI
jgi:hypothetical protein